jgi:hypothetical protein
MAKVAKLAQRGDADPDLVEDVDKVALLKELATLLAHAPERAAQELISARLRLCALQDAQTERVMTCFIVNEAPGARTGLCVVTDRRLIGLQRDAAAAALESGAAMTADQVPVNVSLDAVVDVVPEYSRGEGLLPSTAPRVLITWRPAQWRPGQPMAQSRLPVRSPAEAQLACVRLWAALGSARLVSASATTVHTLRPRTAPLEAQLRCLPITPHTVFAPTAAVARDWPRIMGFSRAIATSPNAPHAASDLTRISHAEASEAMLLDAAARLQIPPVLSAAVMPSRSAMATYPRDTLRPSPWTVVLRPAYKDPDSTRWRRTVLGSEGDDEECVVLTVVYQKAGRVYTRSFVGDQAVVLV